MAGEVLEHNSGFAGGKRLSEMLRNLGRDQILEILSEGFCEHCESALQMRIETLGHGKGTETSILTENVKESSTEFMSADSKFSSDKRSAFSSPVSTPRGSSRGIAPNYLNRLKKIVSESSSPASVNSKQASAGDSSFEASLKDGVGGLALGDEKALSEEQKELMRLAQVKRKKDFVRYERVDGQRVNVLEGLELHCNVFSAEEQNEIVECVYKFQRMGQNGKLRARTYSEPRKWMRGKGRATIQFGCCYNYAVDKNGNPPGIIRDEDVDPLPPVFTKMIKRMVRWHVLPPTCVPNSCIVNIYDEGDCIPPHIDHHDFVRPFCTVSFLSECNILFGSSLKIVSPGEFSGPVSIPLPVGSVLILQGNGADVAKHCVPAVPSKRISVTFRKMDETKAPYNYRPNPELLRIEPLQHRPLAKKPVQQRIEESKDSVQQRINESKDSKYSKVNTPKEKPNRGDFAKSDEFPPLGSFGSSNKQHGHCRRAR